MVSKGITHQAQSKKGQATFVWLQKGVTHVLGYNHTPLCVSMCVCNSGVGGRYKRKKRHNIMRQR